MANQITCKVAGSTARADMTAQTPNELAAQLGLGSGYSANINGESRDMGAQLSDYDYVVLTKNKVGA